MNDILRISMKVIYKIILTFFSRKGGVKNTHILNEADLSGFHYIYTS